MKDFGIGLSVNRRFRSFSRVACEEMHKVLGPVYEPTATARGAWFSCMFEQDRSPPMRGCTGLERAGERLSVFVRAGRDNRRVGHICGHGAVCLPPSRYARGVRPSVATPPHPADSRPGVLRALYGRFAHLAHEIGKFGIVGAVCYVIDIGLFAAWNQATGQRYVANAVSTLVATTFAFVGNRFWTWRNRERSSLRREYLLYFGFNTVGLGIGMVCLFVSHQLLGAWWPAIFATGAADLIAGKVVGVLLASLFRFWAYRRFVFRLGETPAPSA